MEEAEGGKFCKFFMMSPVKKKSFAKWQWHLLNRCYTKSARKAEKICWKRQNINKWCTKIMKDKDDLTGFYGFFPLIIRNSHINGQWCNQNCRIFWCLAKLPWLILNWAKEFFAHEIFTIVVIVFTFQIS